MLIVSFSLSAAPRRCVFSAIRHPLTIYWDGIWMVKTIVQAQKRLGKPLAADADHDAGGLVAGGRSATDVEAKNWIYSERWPDK